jgi:hypothetical protein
VSPTTFRRRTLAAGALSLALGLAACGSSSPTTDAAAVVSDRPADIVPVPTTSQPEAGSEDTVPTTAPSEVPATTTAPRRLTTPTTAAPATTPPSAPASETEPTTPAPTAPKYAPGQRINPSSADMQTALSALSTRIPLFKPTEPQLRAFADAACAQFDQGQSKSQVEATVRQAVTYVQGASLSPADAEFAVRTVVALRCPGYLQ